MTGVGRRSGAIAAGVRLGGVGVLVIALLLISAALAAASSSHRYWTSFGGNLIGLEASVAVDNSNGSSAHDVYVADTTNNRVLKFRPDGEFILLFGGEVDATTGGDVCTAASGDRCGAGVPPPFDFPEDESAPGLYRPGDLAVDGSAGPTEGDVYVVDNGQGGRVLRFGSDGHRDVLWANEGEIRLPGAAGVAVDSSGRLLVLDFAQENFRVRTYDPNGVELGSVGVVWGDPADLEVDGAGNLYVLSWFDEIVEFAADGSRVRGFLAEPGYSTGFAVDGMSGGVFISLGPRGIARFSGGCSGDPCLPAEIFGERYVPWSGDLASDEGDGALYAVSYNSGASVAAFLPASQIPEVTTGSSSVLGEREADLKGTIDAVGAPAATGCRFEYVTQVGFESDGFAGADSTPCRESVPISAQQEVGARVTGLERGTSYRYRLVVETADKAVHGFDERFQTPILPRAHTGKVLKVGAESALLSGSLESPATRPVLKCEFEVVSYEFPSPSPVTRSFQCDPRPFYKDEEAVEVTGQATFLRPDTDYQYRITVENVDGTVDGLTQRFTTASARPPEPGEEIEEREHNRHTPNGKVRCARKACTRMLEGSPHARVWVSPRFPSSYGWLFEIAVDGHPLHHTALVKGCRSTFAGRGVIARLNACRGRFRIVYRGSGSIRFRWRVFAQCRCAEVGRASASAGPRLQPTR